MATSYINTPVFTVSENKNGHFGTFFTTFDPRKCLILKDFASRLGSVQVQNPVLAVLGLFPNLDPP